MLTYEEANKILLEHHKDSHVTCTMDAGKKFIIMLKPNSYKEDQVVLDNTFTVDKLTKEISEYSPVMDPEEFKAAMNKVVYEV